MAGLLKGRTNSKNDGRKNDDVVQRKEILKRGLIGIIVVLVLAFAASFFGGSADKSPQDTNNAQKDSSEEISLDTSALLNDEANTAQNNSANQVPASRKFDYRGIDEANDQGQVPDAEVTQPAYAPIDPVEPVAPIAPSNNNALVQNGGNDELVLPQEPEPMDAEGNTPSNNAQAPQARNDVAKPQYVKPQPETPSQASTQGSTQSSTQGSTKAVLYCGNFSSSAKAEEQKALMAFQGLSSQVVKHGSSYMLKLGPYKSRDAAKKVFSRLDADGLVSECSLESN